jgi:hypothetical protein
LAGFRNSGESDLLWRVPAPPSPWLRPRAPSSDGSKALGPAGVTTGPLQPARRS